MGSMASQPGKPTDLASSWSRLVNIKDTSKDIMLTRKLLLCQRITLLITIHIQPRSSLVFWGGEHFVIVRYMYDSRINRLQRGIVRDRLDLPSELTAWLTAMDCFMLSMMFCRWDFEYDCPYWIKLVALGKWLYGSSKFPSTTAFVCFPEVGEVARLSNGRTRTC